MYVNMCVMSKSSVIVFFYDSGSPSSFAILTFNYIFPPILSFLMIESFLRNESENSW